MGNSCCCHASCCPSRVHESVPDDHRGGDSPSSTYHNRPHSASSRNSFRKEEAPRSLVRREPSTEHLDTQEEGSNVINQAASAHAWQPYVPPDNCPPGDGDSSSSGEYEMPEEQNNVAAGVFGGSDDNAGDGALPMVSHSFDHSPSRGDTRQAQQPSSTKWRDDEDDDDDDDDHESNSRTRAMLARLQQRKQGGEQGGRSYQGFPQHQVQQQPQEPRQVIVAGGDSSDDDIEGPAEDLPANAFAGF